MRYFIILCFFLPAAASAQQVHKIECDSIGYDTQINKSYIEIKHSDFFQSAFVITTVVCLEEALMFQKGLVVLNENDGTFIVQR